MMMDFVGLVIRPIDRVTLTCVGLTFLTKQNTQKLSQKILSLSLIAMRCMVNNSVQEAVTASFGSLLSSLEARIEEAVTVSQRPDRPLGPSATPSLNPGSPHSRLHPES